jgi:flagellar biogenesis protein FliO
MTLLRVALSFAAVGGLLWLFARAGRGRFGKLLGSTVGKASADPLELLDRRQLTRNSGVALLRAGSRHLLVGVGEDGVRLLTEGDDLVAEPAPAETDTSAVSTPAIDLEELTGDPPPSSIVSTDPQSARTRLPRADRPDPPRTNLVDALREKTVRRS